MHLSMQRRKEPTDSEEAFTFIGVEVLPIRVS